MKHYIALSFCIFSCLHGMEEQLVVKHESKDYSIQPTSFNEKGKKYLEHEIEAMHEAARCKNIYTGLAAIYHEIPVGIDGIKILLQDYESLKYATQFNEFLKTKTMYKENLVPAFDALKKAQYEGAEMLAEDLKRTCVQAFLYEKIIVASDIRVPSNNLRTLFMDKGPEIDGTFLEYNKDIDIQKNKSQARGFLLLMAYYMQK